MLEQGEETKQFEQPVILDCIPLENGAIQFRFAFEGQPYDVTTTEALSTAYAFNEWFTNYAAKTPRCACCTKVIFPGQAVTVGNIEPDDSGHSHFPWCNDTAAGFAGAFNNEGTLVAPWAE